MFFATRKPSTEETPAPEAPAPTVDKVAEARAYLDSRGIGCLRREWKYRNAAKTNIAKTFKAAARKSA